MAQVKKLSKREQATKDAHKVLRDGCGAESTLVATMDDKGRVTVDTSFGLVPIHRIGYFLGECYVNIDTALHSFPLGK